MSDWRENLNAFFSKQDKDRPHREELAFARFIAETAVPALEELREEVEKHGRDVTIRETESSATMMVQFQGVEEITYRIQSRMFPTGMLPYAEVRFRERKGLRYIRAESMFRSGSQGYRMDDIGRDEIIQSFLAHYTRHVKPV